MSNRFLEEAIRENTRSNEQLTASNIILADALDRLTTATENETMTVADQIAAIQAEVAAETSVDASIVALVNALNAAKADPAALDAILAGMQANIAPVQAAVTANTPAAPPTA
jgi:hypothetical protein